MIIMKKYIKIYLFVLFFFQNIIFPQDMNDNERASFEVLPIFNYDSDVGFGYGAKSFLFDYFDKSESLDLILYNSTKGERWYRFVFSMEDFESRQGNIYPLALDVIIDYDKYKNYKYYGIENYSDYDNTKEYEIYTREQVEITAMLSRGFSRNIVVEAGISYKIFNSFNFESEGLLINSSTDLNKRKIKFLAIRFNTRYDTRNSFINPSAGIVALLETEAAFKSGISNIGFFKTGLNLQNYISVFHPKIVLASRLLTQLILPTEIPFQLQLPIGGNRTVRGLPQDRYLSSSTLVINNELRFPLWWRFGGVIGLDIGTTGTESSYEFYDDKLSGWLFSPAAGLRFFMDNFVVRLDLGYTEDYMGIYFNFGHMF
jgi:outer membrane protein assembly factor BamA